MNSSFFKNKTLILLAAFALTMSACAKKDTSSVRVAGRANVTGSSINNGNCSTTSAGKIYDSYGSTSFESRVKSFVSATMDPNAIGTVDANLNSNMGVFLYASFKYDSSGNIDISNSGFTMKIYDSYVNQYYNGQVIQPYSIQFTNASSGAINRSAKTFTATFKDTYGDITFSGSYGSGNIISGTVSYNNYTSVSGSSVSSGTLGQFSIYSCSLSGQ